MFVGESSGLKVPLTTFNQRFLRKPTEREYPLLENFTHVSGPALVHPPANNPTEEAPEDQPNEVMMPNQGGEENEGNVGLVDQEVGRDNGGEGYADVERGAGHGNIITINQRLEERSIAERIDRACRELSQVSSTMPHQQQLDILSHIENYTAQLRTGRLDHGDLSTLAAPTERQRTGRMSHNVPYRRN